MQKQLQQIPPAAASHHGLAERDKAAAEAAADVAATRGRLEQRDAGGAALQHGAEQLQEPTKAAAAAAGGGKGRERKEEVAIATGIGKKKAGQWRSGRATNEALCGAGQRQHLGVYLGELQRAEGQGSERWPCEQHY